MPEIFKNKEIINTVNETYLLYIFLDSNPLREILGAGSESIKNPDPQPTHATWPT